MLHVLLFRIVEISNGREMTSTMFSRAVVQLLHMAGIFCLSAAALSAQTGVIRGSVVDALNNNPVVGATIRIEGTQMGTISDSDGAFLLAGLEPGLYNVSVSSLGYEPRKIFEVDVTNSRPAVVQIALTPKAVELEGVVVGGSRFNNKIEESPLSLRSLGNAEIKRSPGANRDISRVIQTLPGAASTVSFRNDIIIRGGAPNENRFFLDGIEVPTINHFATQGGSGGPVGLLNVDLISNVDYYAGAFPASRGNALSSVFEFRQKQARTDRYTANAVVGASDLGLTLEGPLGDNSSLIVSGRRSYLQIIADLVGLPFLPTYNDAQLKLTHNFDDKNRLSIIGLGAIDDFELNFNADDTETKRYLLNFLPIQTQWSYTLGANYQHFRDDGFYTFVVSRNEFNNDFVKYANNDDSDPDNLTLDYNSKEIDNKFRVEDFRQFNLFNLTLSANLDQNIYTNETFNRFATQQGVLLRNFNSELTTLRWGLSAQASTRVLDERLLLSVGLRADAADYSDETSNLLDQLSPRFSASFFLSESFSVNFNTGIYYQLPANTVLGYRDSEEGTLVNKSNGITWIRSKHLVAGVEQTVLDGNGTLTLEGFYKKYDNYPFALDQQVSLANLGGDFGVVGSEPVTPTSEGRSFGLEFLGQLRATDGYYGILTYTFMRSEFTDATGEYQPSSWDFRHIISLTGGKSFGSGWEVGGRWTFYSGAPYTPFDVTASVQRENWDARGAGLEDFTRVNSMTTDAYHQLNIRVDRKFFFDTWSLGLYLDIQNVYAFETVLRDYLDVERDAAGNPIVDPANADAYLPRFIKNTSGQVLPTIGVIVEL